MDYEAFIDAVAQRTAVPPESAVVLTRATLETLAERLTGGETLDLAAQLAKPLQESLRPYPETAHRFGMAEFVRRVKERAGVDDAQAENAVRAVFATLRVAVSSGEFDDVLAQLPKDFSKVVDSVGSRRAGVRRR